MATKTVAKKTAAKKKPASTGKKVAFGGYTINFAGCDDSLSAVFGSKPIPPSAMTKKIWEYVKKNKLSAK